MTRPSAEPPPRETQGSPPRRERGWAHGARSLRNSNFRLLLFAQLTSQTGYSGFLVGQGWLALELTDSPLWVGVTSTAGLFPFLLLSLPAGVMADRLDRRRLLLTSRTVVTLAFLVEALLAMTGAIAAWQMLALALVAGTGIALDQPAQQRLTGDYLRPDEIPSGAAMVGVVFQLSIIIGPLVGGTLLAVSGPAACFLSAAIGNLLLILAYAAMRFPAKAEPSGHSAAREMRAGIAFAVRHPLVRRCGLLLGFTIFAILPYQSLMPVYVRDELGKGSFQLGLILTAPGIGALLGSWLAAYERIVPPATVSMAAGLVAAGLALFGLGWAGTMLTALPLLVGVGLAWGVIFPLGTSIPLLHTPAALRGRVLSLFFVMWGLQPLGSAAAGLGAGAAGTGPVFAVIGPAVAIVGVILAVREVRQGRANATANPDLARVGEPVRRGSK